MSPRSPRDPVEEDLRIQLEGTWEVLERARERQGALLKTLQSPFWRRRLRQRPELSGQLREQEAPLAEAIAHAERRLHKESSEHHPLRVMLRRLHEQRALLEERIQERLEQRGDSPGASLWQGLKQLEARLGEPRPRPPDEGEQVLLSGGLLEPSYLAILYVIFTLIFALFAKAPWVARLLFPIPPSLFLFWFVRSNTRRYWLTPRRLVWQPILGGTQQLPLDSIPPDGITRGQGLLSEYAPLSVNGRRRVTLASLEHLDVLETLLRMHCSPLLLGRALTPPTYPLALFQAIRQPSPEGPDYWAEPGLLVVRPGRVAFLLERSLDGILRTLFTSWTHVHVRPGAVSLQLLLDQLVLLPAEDFDRCVEAIARPHNGESWDAANVLHGPTPSGQGYQFARRTQGLVLIGRPEASQIDLIGRMLARPAR